jgi:hypothetical protein
MVAPTCFGITLPSSGSVPSAFWEMLNWGAVYRILWMGVLCLVTICVAIWDVHAPRHSVSLLWTSPITLWSISTWIRLTSCRIRWLNPWIMWGTGALKTWDFSYPQRKKSHAERLGDLAGHVMPPYLEITWLGNKFLTVATESRAVWHVAPSCW